MLHETSLVALMWKQNVMRLDRLTESRKLAEEKRKQVKKKLPPPGSAEMDTTAHAEYVLSEEVHKARMAIIRKEEEALKSERESLEREKAAHIRALKRVRDEDGSRFNKHPGQSRERG